VVKQDWADVGLLAIDMGEDHRRNQSFGGVQPAV